MKTSDTMIPAFAEAFAKAQGEFINPERNRTVEVTMNRGGSYTFTYATFDNIIAMARPILSKNGLSVCQSVSTTQIPDDGNELTNVTVTTRLMHASGQWIEDDISDICEGGIQQIGSMITYLRRYSYTAMLGIAAEEDDDGNAASGNRAVAKPRQQLPPCPKCHKTESVIVGKAEYGGGFVCFTKKSGCGHKWQPEAKPAEATPLTADEMNYIGEATAAINTVKTEEDLRAVGEIIKGKPDAIRNALRPLFQARLRELETANATGQPESTSA